jgi:hypothetical protein
MSFKSEYTPVVKNIGNNVRIVDPNPNNELVPLEDLFIFVKLKARQKSKTIIDTGGVNSYEITTLEKNNINLSSPQTVDVIDGKEIFKSKPFLTTEWTEIGGLRNDPEGYSRDFEGFGITNVDIEIKSQTAPKVVIDFVDVRGATLFEQGSCSPYGLFFSLPYPIFELTLKGYYGKPITYTLHLVKFNTRFNPDTGNMESRGEFIGYTFAFLSDMIMQFIRTTENLPSSYRVQEKLKEIYTKITSPNTNIFCDNKLTGSNNCFRITDLIKFVENFEKINKEQIVKSTEYKELVDLTELEKLYISYKESVNNLINNLRNSNIKEEKVDNYSKFFINDDQLKTLIKEGGDLNLFFNKKDGKFLNNIKDILTKPISVDGSTVYPYNLSKKIECLLNNPAQFSSNDKSDTYPLYDKISDKWQNCLSELGYKNEDKDDGYFIDFKYILQDIDIELEKINKKTENDSGLLYEKRKDFVKTVNELIEEELGFIPTIKNIFTVILANVEVFLDVLLETYGKAEEYHNLNSKSSGEGISSGLNKVYPWPTYTENDIEKFPGNNTQFYNWVEVRFVRDFIKAFLERKKEDDALLDNTQGIPGFDNYVPINPLESRLMSELSEPIKYNKTEGQENIYRVIGERMFITLDHSYFQPIRLTDDSLNIPVIGKVENWNPLTSNNIINSLGSIEAYNLLYSLDNKQLIQRLLVENEEDFINKIKTELERNNGLTKKKADEIKKITSSGDNNKGFLDTDVYYIFKPNDEVTLEIKPGIIIHPNPYKMEPDRLFQIIDSNKYESDRGINVPEDEDFSKELENYKNNIEKSTNSFKKISSDFDLSRKTDENGLFENNFIIDKQNTILFNKNQFFCTLAMCFKDSVEFSDWWKDSTGDFKINTENSKGGTITSNMGLLFMWNREDFTTTNTFTGILLENKISDFFTGNTNLVSGLITPSTTTLFSPLVTTPLWLDNVNEFRRKVKGTTYEISTNTQNYNLAYLFLHSLKTTPLINRIIQDSSLLGSQSGSLGDKSMIWSLRSFNTTSGFVKVPKAWLLTLGAQLWRWKEFVGTKQVGNKTVWNKPLSCKNCGTGDVPNGLDPLIQPGFNSHDGQIRKPESHRNNILQYLNKVYANTFVSIPNKYKSVFDSDTQKVQINQINNGKNYMYFQYYKFYKDRLGFVNEKLIKPVISGVTSYYSWPQVYIAPHHIPYVSPEIFNDKDNGKGASFSLITDYWIGKQDYTTLMPLTVNKNTYNEAWISSFSKNDTFRDSELDGNLGMIVQYLPDQIKDEIVENFKKWANGEFSNELLKIIDPVNFNTNGTLYDSYNFKVKTLTLPSSNNPTYIDTKLFTDTSIFSKTILCPRENDKLQSLLTDSYYIGNSTPKIWYGYGDDTQNGDNNKTNQFYEDGFVVSEKQFNRYLKSFYDSYRKGRDKRIKILDDKTNNIDPLNQEEQDSDLELSLYRTFKSLSDKWISASESKEKKFFLMDNKDSEKCSGFGKKSSLMDHFKFVNRTMGDIGDKSVINIDKVRNLLDNPKMSLYQLISDILVENEYQFFPLPAYVNITGNGFGKEDLEDMFRPSFDFTGIDCGPLFLCMYTGGNSRQLDLKPLNGTKCKIDQEALNNMKDDGLDLTKTPSDTGENNGENDNGYTAFKILYGVQNQNHFKNIQLDQSEFSETAESLLAIDKLSNQGGTDKTTKGQNLNTIYLTRSYSCQVESLGNMSIQPLGYFDLQGVPMFSGAYLITEVKHNFKPNNASTSFKGVRQPRSILPLVTDAALVMNIDFSSSKSSEIGTGGSLKKTIGGTQKPNTVRTFNGRNIIVDYNFEIDINK